jgi:hypothetical protein
VQAWSSDNTKMFVTELVTPQSYLDLYDATTTPPTPINRILTDVGIINSISLDALWANTDPNRIYYIPGKSSGHGLELRYVDASTCTAANCTLTSHLVHTFSCSATASTGDIAAGTLGNQIETGSGGQGGMFDSSDRYFSFTCDLSDGSGRHEIDLIRYDRTTDTVTTQVPWYNVCPGQVPAGCAVWSKTGLRHNLIRMNQHPDSRFITVIWQCGARDATWARGCGTELYDAAYNYLGVISAYDGHQDVGFDVSGIPVWVGVSSFRNDLSDERAISIVDLTKVSPTAQTGKRVLLPCSYSRQPTCTGTYLGAKAGASHISMTGSWGSLPGYGLFSTMIMAGSVLGPPNYAPGCLACGDAGFGAMENLAVKIDASIADGSPAQFWRIGRTMAIRDNEYNAEPHTAVNRDFTQIVWGSTWNTDPTSSLFPVYGFWTSLKPPASVALPVYRCTGAAALPIGALTVSPLGCGGSINTGLVSK